MANAEENKDDNNTSTKVRDTRSNRVDPKSGQSRSVIKEDAGGQAVGTGEGATSSAEPKSGAVANAAMQTDNLETKSLEEVTFAAGDEMIRPTAMADTGKPATEDDAGTGRPTTLADGREQTGETTSTGLPTAMADEPPSGGQSSGAKKMASVVYNRKEVEAMVDPDHLPNGIKEHQSSGARKTYAGISGQAPKHQNKNK